MAKILFLTNVIRRFGIMGQTLEKLKQQGRVSQDCTCRWITSETVWSKAWKEELKNTDFLLLKWMGTGLDTPFLQTVLKFLQKLNTTYYLDVSGSSREGELTRNLTVEQIETIKKYSMFGGEKNYYNLWLYMDLILQGKEESVPRPDPVHWCGIYHPRAQKIYTDLAEYQRDFCKKDCPTVGFLFYRDEWVWGDLTYQRAMAETVEKMGLNIICVFSNGIPVETMGMPTLQQVFNRYFSIQGLPIIDVLINVMKFSLTSSGSMTIKYLKQWGVPVLEAYSIMASYEEWKENLEGMNAMEVSISVSLPEFDGIIHGVPIASKKVLSNGDVRYLPIRERVERMARKAVKWAKLHRIENASKKIAIIFHNYPPRNSSIGSALGLDTIESVRRLLALMQEQGYKVNVIPSDTKVFIDQLTSNVTNDVNMLAEKQLAEAFKLDSKEYAEFFRKQDVSVRTQMQKDWGKEPGQVMAYDGNLLIPGTMNGNVFVTVQPPRGYGEDPEKIYHDPYIAPTHQYLAFYYWLREVWQANAVAHIGTHGNLEWLPGKNAGLGPTCYPDIALGELPNIYPYNITITGEGIQAKRRGAACLIEHLPAPQSQAGVYDELEELEKLMEEYIHFASIQPENAEKLASMVMDKVKASNLEEEVRYDARRPFKDYVMKLHSYITELKNSEVHTGLHILGQPPEGEELIEYLWLLTRLPNGEIPSLSQAIAATYGMEYATLIENSALIYEPLDLTYGMLVDRIGQQSREVLNVLQKNDFKYEAIDKMLALPWLQSVMPKNKDELKKISEYICCKLYPNIELTSQEMSNILLGFNGRYIEPGPSGAPSSGGADLLPTGRNFYGIDPRTLPTPAAWEIGKTLGDQVIERFIAEEGHYPENIGIVLWSGANMRSHGQCVAEFLYLLGIKPKYQSGSMRVNGLEIISLEELQRPRIDVTARISGLFRDTMPNISNLLDRAVLMVGNLQEPLELNFVRKHILSDSKELERNGLTQTMAWRQASYRIFGDARGTYGAGVAALLESKNWNSIDDIADVYVRWGAHAYGVKTQGEYLPIQFRKRMGSLDITIKNEDNHETNMLSSDDYNAYHGGMIAAVRSIKGSAPKSYCGDSTDRSRIVMHSVQEEAKRVFRSESINPKYIAGMMKHGYKGAADMANMIAHSFQWDATSAVMEDWMYEKYAEKYTFDPKVQQWLRDVNPWALQRMAEILLEAEKRGLWNTKTETKEELQKLYLEMEGELEERADDQ